MSKIQSFKSVAILGPGLLGGSIIKAVHSRLPKCEIRVWARRSTVLEHPDIKQVANLASTQIDETLAGADLIILATPIQHMKSLVERFPSTISAVVTDVGSTKVSVVNEITPLVSKLGGEFIGSHPMAGSDKTGIDHANADLFDNAPVVLTTHKKTSKNASRLEYFWQNLGAEVYFSDPSRHDEVIAAISHLPHLMASALVRHSLNGQEDLYYQLSGSGIRDTTRIAAGDVDMWTEIMLANQASLLDELVRMIGGLEQWKQALESSDNHALNQLLLEAKQCRDKLN